MNTVLPSLNESYQYVMQSTYSSFYRELYRDASLSQLTTLHDWQALPELTKEHIGSVPLAQRLFTPMSAVRHIRLTSGTSGGRPIAFPRNHISPIDAYISCTSAPKCSLWFFNPTYNYYLALQQAGFINTTVIAGDVQNLTATATQAAAAGVDHISCTVSQLQALIPHLQAITYTEQINRIDLSGERLSQAQKDYFYVTFPNATIGMLYGLTETQSMPGICFDIKEETHYRATADFYLETNSEGELLVTHLNPAHNCFPLLRYNTRDLIELTTIDGQQYFKVLGRSRLDTIKIPGGVIMTTLVEKALYNLHPNLTPEFELHYSATPKPSITLNLELQVGKFIDSATCVALADTFAQKLHISPSYTYQHGINDGLYEPVHIKLLSKITQKSAKKIRLFID